MKKGLILLLTLGVSFGCTKEKYEGTQSFWYDSQTSADLQAFGITEITMKVDGMVVGTVESHKHYVKAPECGTGSFVFKNQMFKKQNRTHKYQVFAQNDSLIWEGTFMMSQGKCGILQLDQ